MFHFLFISHEPQRGVIDNCRKDIYPSLSKTNLFDMDFNILSIIKVIIFMAIST